MSGPAPAAQRAPSFMRRRVLLVSLGACVPLIFALVMLNRPLVNGVAPQGVASFELAGTLERQGAVLASWNNRAMLHLAFSLGLDFAFLPAYVLGMALACFALAGDSRPGRIVAYATAGMGAFWFVQNTLMAAALFGHRSAAMAGAIYSCAVVKFAVMSIGFLYVIGMLAVRRRAR